MRKYTISQMLDPKVILAELELAKEIYDEMPTPANASEVLRLERIYKSLKK
jgi:hypothetical protein